MKKATIPIFVVIFLVFSGTSFAADVSPIPITAEQAFHAVQTQTDPITGEDKKVALVDVRTRAEYFWVGAASQVDKIITTEGKSITPDYGKVLLTRSGLFLRFKINNHDKRLQAKKVSEIFLSPIGLNIPYKLWNEQTGTLSKNTTFISEIEGLKDAYNVLIFFCRSGGRSEDCLVDFNTKLFEVIYEIDQPDGKSGRGGFEGTSYSNVYNGYRGFPERLAEIQKHPSVSWKDTGLPIKTKV